MSTPKSEGKPAFIVPKPRERVDPEKLEEFASKAALSTHNPAQAAAKEPATSAERNRTYLLKLLPEQFDRVEEVLARSTYKSKQQMGEALLMGAIEELAKKLGI